MPASTRRFASPLLFKWDANWGLDSQNRLWALSGNRVVTATFDRGGTTGAASQVDYNGRLFIPGYKTPRLGHYVSGSGPLLLLEGARTNGLTFSEVEGTSSTLNNTTIDANATTAPDSTSTADHIAETNAAGVEHGVSRNAALPATTVSTGQSISVFLKAAERSWAIISTVNRDGAAWRSYINLATGAWGTTNANHTNKVIVALGSGWYRACLTFDSGAAAGPLQFAVNASTADNTLTYNGVTGSGIYVWGRQWEADKSFPSSYIPTGASAVTRAADANSYVCNIAPGAGTWYVKFRELTTLSASNERVFSVGNGANARLEVYRNATGYTALLHNGTTSVTATVTLAAVIGDLVELRLSITATTAAAGTLTLSGSLNSATEINGSASSTITAPTTYAAQTLTFGADGAGGNQGYQGFEKFAQAGAAAVSLATLRAA